MKIVIDNVTFKFDVGCRLLKLKHEHSPFEQLNDIWGDIKPMSFMEIAEMENLEERRVGILCLGIERIVKEVNPKLIDKQTIEKETHYIDKNGKYVKEKFLDTYSLYEVKGEKFGKTKNSYQKMSDCYFVKFKDTSTDREYMIWVEPRSVFETNQKGKTHSWYQNIEDINAIQCIAWTMQTNVPEGNIAEILRQGDCILVKPKNPKLALLDSPRHLTEKEYKKFLVAES